MAGAPIFLIIAIIYLMISLEDDDYPDGYIETYYHNLDTEDIY